MRGETIRHASRIVLRKGRRMNSAGTEKITDRLPNVSIYYQLGATPL